MEFHRIFLLRLDSTMSKDKHINGIQTTKTQKRNHHVNYDGSLDKRFNSPY